MRRYLFVIISGLILFLAQNISGQTITPAGGGDATGSGGAVSYTIGQTIVAGADDSKSLSQGFQQPYEILVVGINEMTGIKLDCSLFPNPATDFIRLKIENYDGTELNLVLIDMGGTLLLNTKLESDEMLIPMQNRKPGSYILKLNDGKRDLKIFKIIKK
jgi:hypothetical protein